MTRVDERMKLLNCVSQDMEALANIWQAPQGRYQNIEQMCQTTFRAIAKWRPEVGCQTKLASRSQSPGGSDKVLGLRNTSTSIIAFLTLQSRLHMLADCAPRPNVHTLSHGRALYCIRAPGMIRTYVAKEPYGGLGLIV